ncbi:MAG: hypothetical protein R2855_13515 [Thermomicrobiales bacterium]
MLIAALRRRRAPIDIGLMWLLAGLALVVYFDIFATQIVDVLSPGRVFGLSDGIGAYDSANAVRAVIVLWGVLPLLAGFAAWYRNRGLRQTICCVPDGPRAGWGRGSLARDGATLVHLDLALGTVLLYPRIGLALAEVSWDRARLIVLGVAVLGLGLLAAQQTRAFDRRWPIRPNQLPRWSSAMKPGDQVLADERWPYALALYGADRIEAPNDVLDESLLFERDVVFRLLQLLLVCRFAGDRSLERAGHDRYRLLWNLYEPVVTASSSVSSVSDGLRDREHLVQTVVRHNTKPFQGTYEPLEDPAGGYPGDGQYVVVWTLAPDAPQLRELLALGPRPRLP